ncbi:MAG: hypothetical protein A3E07_01065 [Candidatus Wildermuthbacteria bacterium RIFCSPHIGHO2_12_FULL_45_9]|uniref:DUF4446 domain-containing protein n=1 Tax=Candidatus Wildermuthbacteria bacterium RIFCSPHIGHO2_02_FULL_45_25 TaxID=1802450 RepID=A0A1G2R0S6_9BACT|nr:MAG: hypothetical protein A2748_02865 [Candidatus Wildermuthbacteria bacterium RIFCSPHIGHO2_01_FULL_45_20]OHA66484.1 MAG: hypothetical protein A3C04_04045 [Candidatus Wildermuthbacteria bacterium RIFCSPHIGHO2_02_FULL_45_25]OHA72452.1 MAG: hypothetical protein A3E07_01065 [Candidatus Wildermuthbacteria bacterium RIFCSPHIGHO2_12_FULL_45_9]
MFSRFQGNQSSKEQTPKELIQQVQKLQEDLANTKKELQKFQQEMKKAITKVGVIRFNPFREIGGDQSFSVALLDESNNGVVITSYYGRDVNRIYAKPIQKGSSEYQLANEETEAVKKAMQETVK